MKQSTSQQLWSLARKPTSIMVVTLLIGLMVNSLLYVLSLQPDFLREQLLAQEIKQLEQQKMIIAQTPLPAKVEEYQVRELLEQIPVRDDLSRLMIQLQEMEARTGVTIVSFDSRPAEGSETEDELTKFINEQLNRLPAGSNLNPVGTPASAGNSGGNQTGSAGTDDIKLKAKIERIYYNLQIEGNYEQLQSFMNEIVTADRLFYISNWNISRSGNENGMRMSFKLSVFAAEKYANSFSPLAPIETYEPVNRTDPTIKDSDFLSMPDEEAELE